ncbi:MULTISPECIES: type II secretion system protein GspC [unclassified Brenneria]|uniref:type II secretion system protein GspC n=1 Tax=unclassified Brenneria TaxID=2634434 RepID=UPI0015564C37|nr:type II secretion system protein GspC [Brenneria sp. hezel4-2-4]MEE3652621.1 type II secretion system protein GspC [Brenneria sp. HEZEL_4_2_4]NPD02579.1 type II secretion system protein GspC [Brenneria sp. hezel4-2-4]
MPRARIGALACQILSPALIRRALFGLFLLLICQQLAVLVWRIRQTEDMPAPGITITAVQAEEKPVISSGFTLFGRPPETHAAAIPLSAADIPLTSLTLSLTGILLSDDVTQSIAIIAKDSQQYSLGVGDSIPGTEASIVTILADRIVIENQGRYEALSLYQDVATDETQPVRATSDDPSENKPPLLATDYLTASPVTANGMLAGYRLNPGRDSGPFYRAGLQDNDLAVMLNNLDLRDAEQARQAMIQLPELSAFSLTVERNGERQDIFLQMDGEN